MKNCKTAQRRKILFAYIMIVVFTLALTGRLAYLMIVRADYYGDRAKDVQQRERRVKAERGIIYDRNGTVLAGNKPVSTISVIHNQIEEPETVIRNLSELLELSEDTVRKRVEKVSSIERIKSNVEKEISDKIRDLGMAGVMVDEDYKRYYPFDSLASRVIGFTGSDNQGIIGLEVHYDECLQGQDGAILTTTNARGIEIDGKAEEREEPVAGHNLYTSLDVNLQQFAMQAAEKVMKAKSAKGVRVIMMNPGNGEIYAMVNVPEFSLNNPYQITGMTEREMEKLSEKAKNEKLNQMWRNGCVSDTYEPGSTFKIVTATSALEAGVVKETDSFYCPGYKIVEDRRIRCHKTQGHGNENFVQGIQNSCNPVFMEVGARLGVDGMFKGLRTLQILSKTGIDVPGEASTIMHKSENVGAVELATMSFGQSFQLSPIRLLTTVSAVINGGNMVTPHFGISVENREEEKITALEYPVAEEVVSAETSQNMKVYLESVVSEGSGSKASVEGYQVGAKTGTSEKLPRHSNKYIASCIGFAPANNPKVLAVVLIDEPEGIYYGGTIAAPVISDLLDNALPYLGVKASPASPTPTITD